MELHSRSFGPVCCSASDCSIWKAFSKRAIAGNLPQVKSLLSFFIMMIKNEHNSLGFIKINDPPAERHLLTYSSLHALLVNSQLPVSTTGVWQQNLSPLSNLSQDLQHKCIFKSSLSIFFYLTTHEPFVLSEPVYYLYYQRRIPYRDV